MKKLLTPALRQRHLQLRRAGMTYTAISEQLGLCYTTLKRLERDTPVAYSRSRDRISSPVTRTKAVDLATVGYSHSSIGRTLGVDRRTVARWIKEEKLASNIPSKTAPQVKSSQSHSPEIRKKALKFFQRGRTHAWISKELNVPLGTVHSWRAIVREGGMAAMNAAAIKRSHFKDCQQKALKLLHKGLSNKEIGQKLGVQPQRINVWRRNAGIPAVPRLIIPAKEKSRILKGIEEGRQKKLSNEKIAASLGVKKSTVITVSRSFNLPKKAMPPRLNWDVPTKAYKEISKHLLEASASGLSVPDIAAKLNVDIKKVYYVRRAIDPEARNRSFRQFTPEERAAAVELAKTMTQVEVAKQLGVSPSTICNWVKASIGRGPVRPPDIPPRSTDASFTWIRVLHPMHTVWADFGAGYLRMV